ncbi:MAG: multidrug effflux MFS transporter [Rhodospirillales bacterium]
MKRELKPLPFPEFVTLLALMISMVAMAIDIMLPALGIIGQDLRVSDPNDTQLVVSSLFAGFAVGQMFAGPLSDSIGRKMTIYIGYVIFITGCVISVTAVSLDAMLVGRVLQGLGAAAPRVITVAIVRDSHQGRAMARIMSIIMAVFILVPAIAPAIGQGLIMIAGWHGTFYFLITMAVIGLVWFWFRQPETLPEAARKPFSGARILLGIKEICGYRMSVGYALSAGCVFGAFVGYLSTAQQVFQTTYALGTLFPLYFGMAALAIGSASICNSRIVMRFGMRLLSRRALIALTVMSGAFLVPTLLSGGIPPLWMFMVWLLGTFFCIGMLFGNFNALAMEPLGHMAGLGAALIGSVSTLLALPLGWLIGFLYDGTVLPLVGGFAVLGLISFGLMTWTERGRASE